MRRAIVPILFGLLATSCGGGSGGDQLSKKAWIAKADRICRSSAAQTNVSAHPRSYSELVKLAGKEATAVSNAHDKLRALGVPSSDGQAVRAWLRQLSQIEQDLKDMRASAKASDADGVKAASLRGTRDTSDARLAAKDLGLKDCGD